MESSDAPTTGGHARTGGHHEHGHHHHHGNDQDQGFKAMRRYARHTRRMWRSAVNDDVVAQLAPTRREHLVDIGAGVGAGASVAALRAGHVFAVEPTQYMRQVLSLRSRLSRHPFSVINGAAEATGLPDTSVQVIMAVNTMHHWTDLAAACRELARIIQPRGRMLLVDENFEDPTHSGYEAWVARQHDRSSGHHFHMVDTARVASELERNGLVVPRHGQQRVAGEPAWVVEARRA